MSNILVIASHYPTLNRTYGGIFYHTRNLYYKKEFPNLTVMCFTAKTSYEIDGINVITKSEYDASPKKWDILVCHAPDRNAYNFISKYEKDFKKIFFFIHGNEVLKINKYIKKEYLYVKNKRFSQYIIQEIRDGFKVILWKNLYIRLVEKAEWIFVSNWMKEEFFCNIKIARELIQDKSHIIYNCVAETFENEMYSFDTPKKYDFITIRGNFDTVKYGVDIVNEIAKQNPKYKFLIVGKGKYFEHFEKSDNVEILNTVLSHQEIVEILDKSRCALMPTRHDAQGVMMCEMATYGIPLITSDIKVCREVLEGFDNIYYIDNNKPEVDPKKIFEAFDEYITKQSRYYKINTCEKELELFRKEIRDE